MKVVITGGAGYLGSHVCLALASSGYQPVLVDNFSGAGEQVLDALARLTCRPLLVERGDIQDTNWLIQLLGRHQPCCVVHLAHYCGPHSTVADRVFYLGSNLMMLTSVLRAMEIHGLYSLQVASSSEVYESQGMTRLTEQCIPRPHGTIGHTHLMIENLLEGMREATPKWRVAVLRLFNPVAAHHSGLIGPIHHRRHASLMSQLAGASLGEQPALEVSSGNPGTPSNPDGTEVRDFTHVMDVATACASAVDTLMDFDEGFVVNVGRGVAVSVLELISMFEKTNRRLVPWQHTREPMTQPTRTVADPTLALHLMGWQARHSLEEICTDTMHWHERWAVGTNGSPTASAPR